MKARPVLSPYDPRSCTAMHEAGHAVVGALFGLPSRVVSIVAKAESAGRHQLMVTIGDLAHPARDICVWLLAGPESEKWFRKCARARGAEKDYALVRAVLELHVDADAEVNRRARRYEQLACATVLAHETWIRIVATQLLVEKALSAQTVRDLKPEADL